MQRMFSEKSHSPKSCERKTAVREVPISSGGEWSLSRTSHHRLRRFVRRGGPPFSGSGGRFLLVSFLWILSEDDAGAGSHGGSQRREYQVRQADPRAKSLHIVPLRRPERPHIDSFQARPRSPPCHRSIAGGGTAEAPAHFAVATCQGWDRGVHHPDPLTAREGGSRELNTLRYK